MRWLVTSAVRLRALVLAAVVVVLGVGAVQLRGARVDVYPEFTQPAVQVRAEALGLSAAEVEQLITVPLEQDLLNGTPWVKRIRSTSMPGLAAIDLVFQRGTDLYRARQMVAERMSQAKALPNVGLPPVMVQPLASASRIAMIGLTSDSVSTMEMSVLAHWQIRPRLMSIPGVANVSIWGQRDRQLQVQVDPRRLAAQNVSLTQLIESTGNALWVSPLSFVEASTPGTGGFVESPNQRLGVQHVSPITHARQLADVAVEGTSAAGAGKRIGDVASVREDVPPLIGDASVGGEKQSLMLVVDRFPGADTATVTRDVEAALRALAPGMTGIRVDTRVFRPTTYLDTALNRLRTTLSVGFVLLLAVCALAWRSWRRTLVVAVTVPLALVAATAVLYLRGVTLTSMTLLGLVAALGLVVDDVVGDVTALSASTAGHRGREDDPDAPRRLSIGAVTAGVVARRAALGYATLVALAVVTPVLLTAGVAAAFGRAAVVGYALAVLASFLVAVFVTPTVALLVLRRRQPAAAGRDGEAAVRAGLGRAFDRVAGPVLARPAYGVAAAAVLAVVALAAVPQLRSGVTLPQVQDRNLLVRVQAAPGTALPEMRRITDAVAAELRRLPGMVSVGSHVGRAVGADEVVDVDAAEIWATVAGSADYDRTVRAVRSTVRGYPGVRGTVGTYAADRLAAAERQDAASDGAGADGRDLVVRVYGEDDATLRDTADDVRRVMGTVEGVLEPRVATQPRQPTVQIQVDLAAAQRHGLRPGDIRRDASTLISGLTVGSLYEQQKIFDVVVWGGPATRHSVSSLAGLLLDTPSGGRVRLGEVARVRLAPSPVAVSHDQVSRSIDVTAAVHGRNPAAVARETTQRLRGLSMPYEYRAEVLGTATQRESARRRVTLAVGVVGILALLLLQAATGGWRSAAVVLLAGPLAVAGAVLAAAPTGGVRSVAAVAAVVAVGTLAVRQGLLVVRRAEQLGAAGPGGGQRAAMRAAAREQAPPVVVAAAATAAALLPAALLGSGPGLEILHPFAVAALGGLVTSTLVVLVVVPALYLAVMPDRGKEER